jgi:cytoskeletal protein CcmA (bactofilin family)
MSTESGNLYIGQGVAFQGAVTVPKTAVIHGDVRGVVTTKNLHVGKDAVVTGQIEADTMEVSGVIQDNIKCNGLLKVHSSGQIHGALEFGDIELASGGVITGKVNDE